MINRLIHDPILSDFKRKKIIVLLGARQVGKTTFLSELNSGNGKVLSLNCDDIDDRLALEDKSSIELKHLLSSYDIVFIDEAHYPNKNKIQTFISNRLENSYKRLVDSDFIFCL